MDRQYFGAGLTGDENQRHAHSAQSFKRMGGGAPLVSRVVEKGAVEIGQDNP
jgi:hypothetical protein